MYSEPRSIAMPSLRIVTRDALYASEQRPCHSTWLNAMSKLHHEAMWNLGVKAWVWKEGLFREDDAAGARLTCWLIDLLDEEWSRAYNA